MDVRTYYRKVREAEATLSGADYFVMVSLATSEGGVAGVRTEVPRAIAAKLMAEGRARVASDEEAREFHQGVQEALAKHDEEEVARRVEVMVVPTRELKKQRERD
jgi:crotonobetainyl-CoA:carnitine CoA-transferase CaiB-like acyl-CoA transferase